MYGEIKALRDANILEEISENVKDSDWIFIENNENTNAETAKEDFAYGETVVRASRQEIKDYLIKTIRE
jgi:hypothetical protein